MIVDRTQAVGDTLQAIWKPILLLAVLDIVVTVAYLSLGLHWLFPADVPLPLVGTGLVVFLTMRNSTAYARWWEARTLWGSVVNQSRNLARSVSILLPGPDHAQMRDDVIAHQIAWAHALRHSLRREDAVAKVADLLPPETLQRIQETSNVPFGIQQRIGDFIGGALRRGSLDSVQFGSVNVILNALTDAQGGLERIRNTPMPQHYAVLPRVFVFSYCTVLPFATVTDLGWLTPVGCALIGILFLTLDRAGANLEDPFARTVHDLPMTAICRTVEIDLKQTLGRRDQPSPVRAILGVLR